MSKYRVIWIDDERDPHKKMPFGLYPWWIHKVPYEFREVCGEPEIVWLRSYDEWLTWCVENLCREGECEYINCFCLDHDLASYSANGDEKTGVDVAYDICEYCIIYGRKLPYYECHSSNPAGKQNIESVFETFKKTYEQGKV